MRKLMWFTLGFGAACAFCAYVWITVGLFTLAAGFLALSAAILIGTRWFKVLKPAAVVCLGISMGLGWFQIYGSAYLFRTAALDGAMAEVTARCTDYSYETDYGCAVEGILYLEGKPYRGKFYVNSDLEMEPGDVLQGKFILQLTTNDGAEGPTFHRGKGIFILAYQRDEVQLIRIEEKPFWAYPAMLRQRLAEFIDRSFPQDAASFAKALLLGDRADIDYETNTAFKVSGIMHIIAVSGLHVTILFTLINLLCFRQRWLVAILGLPALLLFTALAGFSPSVVRACIMQALMILAMLLGRDYDGHTELAFAALVMMVFNPMVITSVSFQLSVGCIMGIFLFQKRIYDWLFGRLSNKDRPGFVKIKRWFASSVSVTLSAMSLTTPLSAYYFGAVSLVGVLTNLLTLWVISSVFYGILLVCLIAAVFPAAAIWLGAVIAWPIRYVLALSKLLSAFPLAAVYTRSVYIVAWLIFVYLLLGVFLLSRTRKPGLLFGCAVFGLCLSLCASWLEPMTDACRMTVLNVGQGQSIILQSERKTYLVDCGGSYDDDAADLAAETLLSQGISRIDGLILTHFDRDHSGGAAYFLSRIPADMIFIPDCSDGNEVQNLLEEKYSGKIYPVRDDILLTYGTTEISIFAPVIPDSGNESSLAVLFRHENCDILITGDRGGFGERMLLKTGRIPEVDVLVAGHHGAEDSTCPELLEAVRPGIVAISVGENSYGHPASALLERLDEFGCLVYRTDKHGNIVFRR